eukprot:1910051-Rhodomonas_salina.3
MRTATVSAFKSGRCRNQNALPRHPPHNRPYLDSRKRRGSGEADSEGHCGGTDSLQVGLE